jgi:hypothetical protein
MDMMDEYAPPEEHHKRYFDCDVPRRHPHNRVDPLGSPAGGVRLGNQRDHRIRRTANGRPFRISPFRVLAGV